tara:strand:- start:374 stop:502 length:129 start_codon:yes stop_codon:yes gene_type:complete
VLILLIYTDGNTYGESCLGASLMSAWLDTLSAVGLNYERINS